MSHNCSCNSSSFLPSIYLYNVNPIGSASVVRPDWTICACLMMTSNREDDLEYRMYSFSVIGACSAYQAQSIVGSLPFYCADEGLEQPIANWAKLKISAQRLWEECSGWLLGGQSLLRTDLSAPGTYRTIDCPQSRSSKLATTRFLVYKLATARLFCSHPPPL